MTLPRLELPPGTLVLFESVPEGTDRSGAYRFAVTHDGQFLHSGNNDLHAPPDKTEDDDPSLFWQAPLQPVATFEHTAVEAIAQAAQQLRQLPEATRRPPGRESSPTIERITVAGATGETPHTVVANAKARPQAVATLLQLVEQAGKDQG